MSRLRQAQRELDTIIEARTTGVELARRIGKPVSFHYKRSEDKIRALVCSLAGEVDYAKEVNDILTNRDREMTARAAEKGHQ